MTEPELVNEEDRRLEDALYMALQVRMSLEAREYAIAERDARLLLDAIGAVRVAQERGEQHG